MPVAVEVVEPINVPAERASVRRRRVGPEHAAVLAAHEIDAAAELGGRTDEEIDPAVAVLVSRQREIPAEVLARGLRVLPKLLARLRRARHEDAARDPIDLRVGRRDDDVGEPVAREVRHRHHPVPEEAVVPFAIPLADGSAARTRPHRGSAVLLRAVPELETSAGGDVRVTIAVDVEWLAEAEPELTAPDAPGDATRHTPASTGSGAGRRGPRGSRQRTARNREATGEEGGGGSRASASASPARACPRRHVLH